MAPVVAGDLVSTSTVSVLSILCTVRSDSFLSATKIDENKTMLNNLVFV